ncbi:MAG TPA: beta-propeller fold lactonase family protein [Kofleriaceae bacterium]|nr:beta-propeller fold lactonase family protein [Kofleriaceae bacterium]
MRTTWMLLAVASACGGSSPTLFDGSTRDATHADGAQGIDAAIAPVADVYASGYGGLVGFGLDGSGGLAPLGGTWPVQPQDQMIAIAVHPSGKYLYSANTSQSTIARLARDPATGQVTFVDDTASDSPAFVAMDPKGRALYVSEYTGKLRTYTIDASTGALTDAGAITVPIHPYGIAIDPEARVLVVAGAQQPTGTITLCTLDAQTGKPTAGQTLGGGNFPVMVAIDATATHVYTINDIDSTLQAYTIDPIAATGAPLATVSTGTAVSSTGLVLAPSGKYAYVANNNGGLASFAIAADGTPQAITSYPVYRPRGLGFDPSGAHLLVGGDDRQLTVFAADAQTGTLTQGAVVDASVMGGYVVGAITR